MVVSRDMNLLIFLISF